jgi:hypothetical protein
MDQEADQGSFPVLSPDAATDVYLRALQRVGAPEGVIDSLRDALSASAGSSA